jgi:tRNA pseudouridine55 synthase
VAVRKPAGPTSHDVVATVRRALGGPRAGHLGTLDPLATGVLVVALGRATRLARFADAWSKTYEGVMRLGVTTTTDDATGAPVARSEVWREVTADDVRAAFARFRGTFDQRPPPYSAVKVGGERAYRRARRGEPVELAPRPVTVTALDLVGYRAPDARFRAVVSAGTYVRSLARDVGEALGCGAHLAELIRTAVGPFALAEAVPPEAVTWDAVRPADALVADLPRRELSAEERVAVVHGRPLEEGAGGGEGAGSRKQGAVALLYQGTLVAVAEITDGALKPRVVVADP